MEKKQVKINGLAQNCFVSELRISKSIHIAPVKVYPSLEKKTLSNGVVYDMEQIDYPITAESVTSYIDSADYRRDPMSAIANAPKRVNLGDITEVQEFIQSSPQEAVRLYRAVGEQLEKFLKQQQTPATDTPATETPATETPVCGIN